MLIILVITTRLLKTIRIVVLYYLRLLIHNISNPFSLSPFIDKIYSHKLHISMSLFNLTTVADTKKRGSDENQHSIIKHIQSLLKTQRISTWPRTYSIAW